ncbi:MAG: hypothetical protein JETT_1612 [Candidatus Jettenia ecosi]|uniref:Uncharacterized protein n=1 Tax=Candidatus Jettenia ecosi TaxID=2494326 RepID=A0A533QBT7_9BACT|nr:MAG: hypothetical protein JETT_1612 [Candidatus Jettenia ecosi]
MALSQQPGMIRRYIMNHFATAGKIGLGIYDINAIELIELNV